VVGQATSEQLEASWALEFEGDEPPVWHLPRPWMYRAPLPRTKVLSPHPSVLVRGWIDVAERRIEAVGWPATIGHNWGTEHTRRTIWLHGANFADARDAWLDVAMARVGLGPLTTPWVATGELCLEGRRHRLGGLGRVRSTRVDETPEGCRFHIPGDGVVVDGMVGARRQDFVGWIYAQPSGEERQTVNCSIADVRVEVARPGRAPVTLSVNGGGAYELQMEERYPPIPVQPFPDG
jgi:hypothetical protein